ncbi:MAG TPA: hypothetical protein VG329_06770 [Candidatus Dormibacteraeota bacterium]|nr:hypothetical protein [Candidatus Dormibacteraeota bacterium]
MPQPGFSPASDQPLEGLTSAMPPLDPGENIVVEAAGVTLGWQPQTVLIWWVPGLIFIGLAWLEFRSLIVVAGLTLFCAALFAFYASDREVRPRSRRRNYVLTDRRLWVGIPGPSMTWRPLQLDGIASTRMETGLADRVVGRLSAAATIVLVMRDPGPKGEPRRVRIGPMRRPEAFRAAIDAQLGGFAAPA